MKKQIAFLLILVGFLALSVTPQETKAASSAIHDTSSKIEMDVYTGDTNWLPITAKFEVFGKDNKIYVEVKKWDKNGKLINGLPKTVIRNGDKITLPTNKTRYKFIITKNGNVCEWRIKSTSTSITRIDG